MEHEIPSKNGKGTTMSGGRENALFFEPTYLEQKSHAVKRKKYFYTSGTKIALLIGDLFTAIGGFALGVWLAGWGFVLKQNPSAMIEVVILGLTTVAFFRSYNLYSYRFLFTRRRHMIILAKSFCWSLLTFGLIIFLLNSSGILSSNFYVFITVMLFGAGAFIILSRYLSSHLMDFLMALGASFVVVGLSGIIFKENLPAFMMNGLLLGFCFILTAGLVAVVRIFLFHVVFNRLLRRHFRRQVLIAGSDRDAHHIADHILENDAPFWILGTVGLEPNCALRRELGKVCLGDVRRLPAIVAQFKIDDIIITDENIDKPTLITILDFCTTASIDVWFPPKLLPIIDTKIQIDTFCGLPMIRLCSQKNNWLFNKVKHGLDALIAIPLFVLQLPVFAVIALLVKLESPGPVFYRARAIGKNGREFAMYKFRSMRTDADSKIHQEYVTKLIKGEIGNGDGKKSPLKITDDPRVTRVGRILRKLSLDEMPQLINVIKGDMSLVGPRPCLPYEYEQYKDWYKKRTAVRAGITGLWQVAGRSEVSFEDMILLDLYYIYNRNLTLDLNILFETVFVVLGKKGAY